MNNQFLMNMLLSQLKNKNPNGYNQLMSMMNSGKNPETILNDMISSGQISKDQVANAQSYLRNMENGPKTF